MTLKRIGNEEVLNACRLVERGRVYDLGMDIGPEIPHGPRDTFGAIRLTPYRTPRGLREPEFDGHDFSMELIQGSPHLSSHIDGLTHIQARGCVHGGVPIRDAYGDFGWRVLGMETVPPIVTRGLLLDVPAARGVDRLADGEEVRVADLERCLEREGLELRGGEAVLVRTGKLADYAGEGQAYFAAQPGVGVEAGVWLHERGMALLGTDTSGTEPIPFPDERRTVHRALLVERGVHLMEILNLDEIAHAGVHEFLFVCLPLRIVGGTGSWVRPVAVV